MSVQGEIDRINGGVADIKAAITEKGGTVEAGAKVDQLGAAVRTIPMSSAGGGGLDPIVGTTETVKPSQVIDALKQGRFVVISTLFDGQTVYFTNWALVGASSIEIPTAFSVIIAHDVGNTYINFLSIQKSFTDDEWDDLSIIQINGTSVLSV